MVLQGRSIVNLLRASQVVCLDFQGIPSCLCLFVSLTFFLSRQEAVWVLIFDSLKRFLTVSVSYLRKRKAVRSNSHLKEPTRPRLADLIEKRWFYQRINHPFFSCLDLVIISMDVSPWHHLPVRRKHDLLFSKLFEISCFIYSICCTFRFPI